MPSNCVHGIYTSVAIYLHHPETFGESMEDTAECFEKGPFTVNRNYIGTILFLVSSGEARKKCIKKNKKYNFETSYHDSA